MKLSPRRLAARWVRHLALSGPQVLGVLLGLYLAWGALLERHGAAGTALDYASRVLSILSVGRLTEAANRPLLAIWEGLLAVGIAFPRLSRLALWLGWPRLILAILPLVMLRGDLPVATEQVLAAHVLLLGVAVVLTGSRAWESIEDAPGVAELVASPVLTRQGRARRQRQVLGGGLAALVLAAAGKAMWPTYLKWFHRRQETATLSQKMSGRLIKKSMPLSPLLKRKITTWVYLPPGYERSHQRYPVVYVMHGMPGEVRDCFVKGQVHNTSEQMILSRRILPVILVGWDGEGPNGPTDITEYLDRRDGTWQMESFMVQELVPYIDRTYRTQARPESRALAGVSAGGYAAVNLLLKHPDVWKIGASLTGFFDPSDDAENMDEILGPRGALWDANNPMQTVEAVTPAQNLHIYADIGAGDELSQEFARFCALLRSRGIDHACHVFPGRHTWEYWSTHFVDALQFIDARFRLAPAQPQVLGATPGVEATVQPPAALGEAVVPREPFSHEPLSPPVAPLLAPRLPLGASPLSTSPAPGLSGLKAGRTPRRPRSAAGRSGAGVKPRAGPTAGSKRSSGLSSGKRGRVGARGDAAHRDGRDVSSVRDGARGQVQRLRHRAGQPDRSRAGA